MPETVSINSEELERITAELDAEAIDMRLRQVEPKTEAEKKKCSELFTPIYDKARQIVLIVNNCKKLEVDARTTGLEKTLDEIQTRITELRLDIYNLGHIKQFSSLWLSYIIPRLRDLERDIRRCRVALQKDKLDCIYLMTRFDFHTPL